MTGLRNEIGRWIILAAVAGVVFNPAGTQAQNSPERFDLADAVLLPYDLERSGLPGFMVDRANWGESDDVISILAQILDADDRDFEDVFDTDSGFEFAYDADLVLVNSSSDQLISVRNTITQFESDKAAESALAALNDALPTDGGMLDGTWGTASASYTTESSLAVIFQQGQMISVIGMESDFLEIDGQRGLYDDRLSQLADRSVSLIDDALDRSGSEFGVTAVRFEDETAGNIVAGDRFTVEHGQFVPMTDSGSYLVSFMGIQTDSFGIQDAYERFIYPTTLEGSIVNLSITRHRSEELATSFVTFSRDRLDFGGGYANLRLLEHLDLPGDSAIAFTYSVSYSEDLNTEGVAVAVQIGDQAIALQVDGMNGVSEDDVMAVVEMQIACLSGGTCEPVPYPGEA